MTRRTPLCPACKNVVIIYRHDGKLRAECTRCEWKAKR